jgi:hypothetical protein
MMMHSSHAVILLAAFFSPVILSGVLLGVIWKNYGPVQTNLLKLNEIENLPCGRCLYFTGNHHLTCTVRPHEALTEEAVDCFDFAMANSAETKASTNF